MARSFDQKLAALRTLDPTSARGIDELRDALRSTNGVLAAAAAKIVGDHHLETLVPELAPAFERFMVDPVKRDPLCRAKIAIPRALDALEHWEERVFVPGIRIVQKEGARPATDTAAEVRGVCGLAHVRFGRPETLDVLARLLADPERTPRVAAAQGLGDARRPDATALLRYKIAQGDEEAEVLSAAIDSLLILARDASIPFLIELLAVDDLRAEVAALALGGARIEEAFEPLVAWSELCNPSNRQRSGYLAIALLRGDRSTAHLLEIVHNGATSEVIAAANALATFKDDRTVAERLREAAARQRDAKIRSTILATLE